MKPVNHITYGCRIISTELCIPNLAKLAKLYGVKGYTITKKEELTPVFKEALAKDDFVIIDVKMD